MKKIILVLLVMIELPLLAQTKVMTYNIRNSNANDGVNAWNKRRESFVAVIRKVNPDILGTQEVLLDQLKYLQKSLNDYESFGVGRNDGKHKGEHSALFFKKDKYDKLQGGSFWLSETPGVPGSAKAGMLLSHAYAVGWS